MHEGVWEKETKINAEGQKKEQVKKELNWDFLKKKNRQGIIFPTATANQMTRKRVH